MKEAHSIHQPHKKNRLWVGGALLLVALSGAAYGLYQRRPDALIEMRLPSWQAPQAQTLETNMGQTWAVAISPDGKSLASASENNTIQLWNLQTGALIKTLDKHSQGVFAIAVSPRGDRLASASQDKTTQIWDLQPIQLARTLSGHTDSVRTVAFNHDGTALATGSNDKTIKLWNANTGALVRTLEGHTDLVNSVAFSPDGKTLVSGSEDKTIKVWSLEAKRSPVTPVTLEGDHIVTSVAFSALPNAIEQSFASGEDNGIVKIWRP